MGAKEKEKSTTKSIIAEIAHDLGISKSLVKEVLILTFKEIAIALILKGKPVMIRRFVKSVVALSTARKIKKSKTKEKSE